MPTVAYKTIPVARPSLSSYRILARALDWHLGDTITQSEGAELVASINLDRNLVSTAEAHALAPLFNAFAKDQLTGVLPYTTRQLQALALRHKHAAKIRLGVLEQVINTFRQNGVALVLLKGAALGSMVYPDPSWRPMRDIDVLVSADDTGTARSLLVQQGFKFETSHASMFMGNMHHLPNATKQVDGLTISLEVHHQVFSRDVQARQGFEQVISSAQEILVYGQLECLALDHYSMLNHICRHGFALCEEVRLIHQFDILKYLQCYADQIDWRRLGQDYPFVVNTARCLHYSLYVPHSLRQYLQLPDTAEPAGVGDAMLPYSQIVKKNKTLAGRFKALLMPSAWWMHVYYQIPPEKSLFWCYLVRHPAKVLGDILKRLYHGARQSIG